MDEAHPNHTYAAAADVLKQAVAVCDIALDDATTAAAVAVEEEWDTGVSAHGSGCGVVGDPHEPAVRPLTPPRAQSAFSVDGRRPLHSWDGADPPTPPADADADGEGKGDNKGDEAGGGGSETKTGGATGAGAGAGAGSGEGGAGLKSARTVWTQTPTYLADALLEDDTVRARKVQLGDALTRLALVYSRQGLHFYVEPLLVRAIEMLEDGLGRNHMEVRG